MPNRSARRLKNEACGFVLTAFANIGGAATGLAVLRRAATPEVSDPGLPIEYAATIGGKVGSGGLSRLGGSPLPCHGARFAAAF